MGALRKCMPITSATLHRRLAGDRRRAAVRRASGRRTRSCSYAWDKSPVLWVVGVVTALLTAYYMTRQVILVFFGKARWDEASPSARRRPPEAAAGAAAVGAAVADDAASWPPTTTTTRGHGARPPARVAVDHDRCRSWCWPCSPRSSADSSTCPFGETSTSSHQWLEAVPFVEETERGAHTSAPAPVGARHLSLRRPPSAGIVLAWLVYQRHRIKAVEPDAARATAGTSTRASAGSWPTRARAPSRTSSWFDDHDHRRRGQRAPGP